MASNIFASAAGPSILPDRNDEETTRVDPKNSAGNVGALNPFGGQLLNNTTEGALFRNVVNNAASDFVNQPNTNNTRTLFGNINTSNPVYPAGSLFGHKPACSAGGLFGQNTAQSNTTGSPAGNQLPTGGLFGNSNQNNNPGVTLFGHAAQQPTGGLFDIPPPQSGSSLFGPPITNQGEGGLFGRPQQSAGGLFSHFPPHTSGSLFGPTTTNQASSGLFGRPQQTTVGLFGNTNTSTRGGLFGTGNTQTHQDTGSGSRLFGNNSPATNNYNLFGNLPKNGPNLFQSDPHANMSRSNFGVSPCRGCHYAEITTTSVQPNGDKTLLSQTTTPIRLSALDSASIEEVRLEDYKNGRDPRHSYTGGDYDVELVRLRAEVGALQCQVTQKDQELRCTQANVTKLEAELAQYHQQSTKVATDKPVTSALPAMLEPFAERMQAVERQLAIFTESLEKSGLTNSTIIPPILNPIETEKGASASAQKEREQTETHDDKMPTLHQKREIKQSEVEQPASGASSSAETVFTPASGTSTPQGGDAEEFSRLAPRAQVAGKANANLSYIGHDGQRVYVKRGADLIIYTPVKEAEKEKGLALEHAEAKAKKKIAAEKAYETGHLPQAGNFSPLAHDIYNCLRIPYTSKTPEELATFAAKYPEEDFESVLARLLSEGYIETTTFAVAGEPRIFRLGEWES